MTIIKWISCPLSFVCFFSLLPSETSGSMFYSAREDKGAIVDGKLDEPVWEESEWMETFSLLGTAKEPSQKTEFALFYGHQNIYIGVRCYEKQMGYLLAEVRVHDGAIWQDDCIEIFFDPEHSHESYYHFIANSLGTKFEEEREGRAGSNKEWNDSWQVAVFKNDTYWSAEIAIPFSTLTPVLEKGKIWGFNICRERYSAGPTEYSCWANTGKSFLEPELFGHLVFEDFKFRRYLEARCLAPLEEKLAKVKDLLKELSPSAAGTYRNDFAACHSLLIKARRSLSQKTNFTSTEMSGLSRQSEEAVEKIEKTLSYLLLESILESDD